MRFNVCSILVGATVAAGLALATPAIANAQVGYVVQGNYGTEIEAIGVGGGINFGVGSLTTKHGIRAETTFDYFFADNDVTYWELNGNLLYDLKSVENLYLGAGINYAKINVDFDPGQCGGLDDCDASNSDIGLNILGGFKLGTGKAAPFVQARFEIGGGENLVVSGGFRF